MASEEGDQQLQNDLAIARALQESDDASHARPAVNIPDDATDRALALALDDEARMVSPNNHQNSPHYDTQINDLVTSRSPNGARAGGLFGRLIPRTLRQGHSLFSIGDPAYQRARRRLHERLALYELAEIDIAGDGNCQFASIADQLYRDASLHGEIRELVVRHLAQHPDVYSHFLDPEDGTYDEYLADMSQHGHWGDHLTLQAAADRLGVQINLVTSEADEIVQCEPQVRRSERVLWLSYAAEFHYNSLYPATTIDEERDARRRNRDNGKNACAAQ